MKALPNQTNPMKLKNIVITIEADGFTIVDNANNIPEGAAIRVQYETASGWVTKDIAYQGTSHMTLFHPWRKTMFVYTGLEPSRIVLQPQPPIGQWGTRVARPSCTRQQFIRSHYSSYNYCCFPDIDDNYNAWDDDYLAICLGTIFDDSLVNLGFIPDASDGLQSDPQSNPQEQLAPQDQSDPQVTATAPCDSSDDALMPTDSMDPPDAQPLEDSDAADSSEPNAY